ncbi:MAG TPA: type II toxin-antitoxin system VapC family toxin [Rhizomicrobium sp.]
MIILDTNVLSEFTRAVPAPMLVAWFGSQDVTGLWTTTITEAEMLVGLALLPTGRRKNELSLAVEKLFGGFDQRILPFDRNAARELPAIVTQRRSARLQTRDADGQIAAIARAHDAAVATRNISDFEHCGIRIINPWTL